MIPILRSPHIKCEIKIDNGGEALEFPQLRHITQVDQQLMESIVNQLFNEMLQEMHGFVQEIVQMLQEKLSREFPQALQQIIV